MDALNLSQLAEFVLNQSQPLKLKVLVVFLTQGAYLYLALCIWEDPI